MNLKKSERKNRFRKVISKEYKTSDIAKNFYHIVVELFDLKHDTDEEGTVESITKSITFRGANLWSLVFAILIASIGLNVNSTAVIIGAMLISPLMGPILGIGLGAGINEIDLIKRSLKNLFVAVFISIMTSSIYFWITPLTEAQSELLARTQPTIFDVLIAIFGGATGIIAGSRKDKTNAIPGVAIATALMPPLCTAGFGLANGYYKYFIGAFYLFFINSIFIALTTFIFVRYLNFKKKIFIDKQKEKRVRRYIYVFVIISILPSIYTGWNVVSNALFKARVKSYIRENFNFRESNIISANSKFNYKNSTIEVTLIGDPLPEEIINGLENRLSFYKLNNCKLTIHQPKKSYSQIKQEFSKDFSNLEQEFSKMNQNLKVNIVQDLYKKNEEKLLEKEKEINQLNKKIKDLENNGSNKNEEINQLKIRLKSINNIRKEIPVNNITKELKIEYPYISEVGFSQMEKISEKDKKIIKVPTFTIKWSKRPYYYQKIRVESFLKARTEISNLKVIHY